MERAVRIEAKHRGESLYAYGRRALRTQVYLDRGKLTRQVEYLINERNPEIENDMYIKGYIFGWDDQLRAVAKAITLSDLPRENYVRFDSALQTLHEIGYPNDCI